MDCQSQWRPGAGAGLNLGKADDSSRRLQYFVRSIGFRLPWKDSVTWPTSTFRLSECTGTETELCCCFVWCCLLSELAAYLVLVQAAKWESGLSTSLTLTLLEFKPLSRPDSL